MTDRLVDRFAVGDRVSIRFSGELGEYWWPGQVVLLDHPGVWVALIDGGQWYVTNGRRIKLHSDGAPEADHST